jgi:hypothetical protein
MKYQTGEYEAVHRAPAWRDRADFVFSAYLGIENGKKEWEQLWGKQVAPNKFILCCIPFFVYGISLGDELETDNNFVLHRVVRQGGQATFRVWFGEQDVATRDAIVHEIEDMRPLMEWSSDHLLALSVPDGDKAQEIANYLQAREEDRVLQYETGRAK